MRKALAVLAVALGLTSSSAFAWHDVVHTIRYFDGSLMNVVVPEEDPEDLKPQPSRRMTKQEKALAKIQKGQEEIRQAQKEIQEAQRKQEEFQRNNKFVRNGTTGNGEEVWVNDATHQRMYVDKKTGRVRFN